MVYPPTTNNEPIVRDSTIDQSVLFDLFEVDQTHRAKLAHHQDQTVINILETGEITSIDDFEQEEGNQEPENSSFDYGDLPELSEHEKTIDWEDS